ncbi:biotin--[acetyl-CoA-carboxylase] ligase [Merismopedia glauca]|uniref:Biotin--[acetyl-CoA-carboxylase] ligase n=1 Tax=Merismopedia glauca CCAP 1448/3 TaxID=1296344 RepID=A0A2T1CAA3_9CYAN|nr:biotin--[acetyl-CoA-carboxylase] ligase [Merismopedia glauca]PSB05164.1 biotin--[acetyl-CoA-carboxylase] ligase [Merismopedia glauca CCAP 1448/3]
MGFNRELVGYWLGDRLPLKINLQVYDTLASTSETLWKLMEKGASPGTVVVALQQTAGRGQWGRQWSSNLGGLYLSLALTPNLPTAHSSYLTICTAWGIATQLRDYEIPVELKWPNDLILDRRKLGGILTETRIQQDLITQAVVGVGINWTNRVPEVGINLQDFLTKIDSLEKLAALTIQGIVLGYSYCNPQKFKTIIPAYKQLLTSDTYRDTTAESELFFQQLEFK